jgi:hypothetical protein
MQVIVMIYSFGMHPLGDARQIAGYPASRMDRRVDLYAASAIPILMDFKDTASLGEGYSAPFLSGI